MSRPLPVSQATYDRVKNYSDIFSTPLGEVADEALNDWLDTVGEANIEEAQERQAHPA